MFSRKKPKINMNVDVKGWAWWNKAMQLKKWLSDDFDIKLVFDGNNNCDLYFSFEKVFPDNFKVKYISGICAHHNPLTEHHKNVLCNATAIHANSMLLYNEYKHLNENCYYVPNGVDEKQFYFKERDINKPFTAGYVGKPTNRKGLLSIIIPACKKAGVELKIQACRYKDKNKINHSKMHKFYHDIDVIMVASTMDSAPNQLLEAASCGRMFIGNRIGNIPEFYNMKNGIMVSDRDNVSLYSGKLKTIKNNREQICNMGIEARKTVEKKWTWKKQAENYRKMFWDNL